MNKNIKTPMTSLKKHIEKEQTAVGIVPFQSAEEAWFWFVAAQEARCDGARIAAGQGLYPRPCEPVDILRIIDRMYRQRRLLRDHLLVLRHYGCRRLAPDRRRMREMRAYTIWTEALNRMESVLESKGIVVRPRPSAANSGWLPMEGARLQ